MRLLKDLLKSDSTVWICCESDDSKERFLHQAEEEGFIALSGIKPTELFHHRLYGISDDMTMGYLSNMIWNLTFRSVDDKHVRIDYEKYMVDEEDYVIVR